MKRLLSLLLPFTAHAAVVGRSVEYEACADHSSRAHTPDFLKSVFK